MSNYAKNYACKRNLSKPKSTLQQYVTHVFQVSQVPPVLRGREERREIGDKKERREDEEPKEIKVLWDHQEKTGSKESWDLRDPKVI